MKKIFLAALLSLSASSAFADMTNGACFQPQNAIEFTLANGTGWNSAALSDITSTVTPTLTPENYFQLGTTPTADSSSQFYSQFLSFPKVSLFNSNMSWSGEFSIAGKFALGGSLFARLSAFIGANLGFSQAQIPVTGITVEVSVNGTGDGLETPVPKVPFLTGYKPVTMKSGLGYGIMVGLGKETSFGSMSVDLGVVFRSFRFYFPSATAIQTSAGVQVTPKQGLKNIDILENINDFTLSNLDNNTYGSYYNRFTQTGFRFGGSLSFKLIENLSFGVSIAAEIFGNQTFTITPNLSSFSSTATTASATTTTTTTTDTNTTGTNTTNGKNINNTGMAYSTVTAAAKNVVTSVMMTLTYSVPVGN